MRRFLILCSLTTLFLSSVNADGPVSASEYAARRAKVAAAIGPNAILIALSGKPSLRNGDVEFPFRQNDNLLYLTGVDAPDATLVLLPGEPEKRETLFVQNRDPLREVWTGKIPTFDSVKASSGVQAVYGSDRFRPFLGAILAGGSFGDLKEYRAYRPPVTPAVTQAVDSGKAELYLLLGARPSAPEDATAEMRLADEMRRRYPELRIRDASSILRSMREVKSPAEMVLLQRAIDVTAEGHKAAMRRILTAQHEYEVQATIEYTFRNLGACCWGFPSIVASGTNGTTLHYETNNDPIQRDALLVADIGAEVEGYTADVTRTFPADGTFSPEQRSVYEAVYNAQEQSIPLMREGSSFSKVHAKAEEVLGEALLRMGLITKNTPPQVRLYFFHGVGHQLGLDVHDVFDRTRLFAPGMVLTNEPGIYVRKADVLANDVYKNLTAPEQKSVLAALDRYEGIGVRIEDDILVTSGEPKLLSAKAPRSVADIEAFMKP